jgi:hypothetical protein
MNKHDLFEKISNWNSMYNPKSMPAFSAEAELIKRKFEEDWDNGFLKNASELETITELKGIEIEIKLLKAINLAKSYDRTKLGEIHDLLMEVQKYMFNNHMF